jgi:hypothetical protein
MESRRWRGKRREEAGDGAGERQSQDQKMWGRWSGKMVEERAKHRERRQSTRERGLLG